MYGVTVGRRTGVEIRQYYMKVVLGKRGGRLVVRMLKIKVFLEDRGKTSGDV